MPLSGRSVPNRFLILCMLLAVSGCRIGPVSFCVDNKLKNHTNALVPLIRQAHDQGRPDLGDLEALLGATMPVLLPSGAILSVPTPPEPSKFYKPTPYKSGVFFLTLPYDSEGSVINYRLENGVPNLHVIRLTEWSLNYCFWEPSGGWSCFCGLPGKTLPDLSKP